MEGYLHAYIALLFLLLHKGGSLLYIPPPTRFDSRPPTSMTGEYSLPGVSGVAGAGLRWETAPLGNTNRKPSRWDPGLQGKGSRVRSGGEPGKDRWDGPEPTAARQRIYSRGSWVGIRLRSRRRHSEAAPARARSMAASLASSQDALMGSRTVRCTGGSARRAVKRAGRGPRRCLGSSAEPGLTYRDAGVNIDAGSELVRRIAKMCPEIGGFSGLYPFGEWIRQPVRWSWTWSRKGSFEKADCSIQPTRRRIPCRWNGWSRHEAQTGLRDGQTRHHWH